MTPALGVLLGIGLSVPLWLAVFWIIKWTMER